MRKKPVRTTMPMPRSIANTLFADDIREEVTGKSILIGLYGVAAENVQAPLNLVIFTRIVLFNTVDTPRILVRATLNENIILDQSIDSREINKYVVQQKQIIAANIDDDGADWTVLNVVGRALVPASKKPALLTVKTSIGQIFETSGSLIICPPRLN